MGCWAGRSLLESFSLVDHWRHRLQWTVSIPWGCGKACGSRTSILSCFGKFQQSSLPFNVRSSSEMRTFRVQNSQTVCRMRSLEWGIHHLFKYRDDGYCKNQDEMMGICCSAIWKHLKTPVRLLLVSCIQRMLLDTSIHPRMRITNIVLSIVLSASFQWNEMMPCFTCYSFPWQQPQGLGSCSEQHGPSPANIPIWGGTRKAEEGGRCTAANP